MLSRPATKLFFKTTEPRAAKWISDAIGEIEVERLKESRSIGMLLSRKSYAMEIATKPLVLASEISGLKRNSSTPLPRCFAWNAILFNECRRVISAE